MTTIYIILSAFAAGIAVACLLSSLLSRRPKEKPEDYWNDMLRQLCDEPELSPSWRKSCTAKTPHLHPLSSLKGDY